MAIEMVTNTDPRFDALNKGRNNGRFPTPEMSASGIALCRSGEDVAGAVGAALKAGKRPTIRSGGHCYEDFVYNNPGGTIIDVRDMNEITQDPVTKRWRINAGATVGEMYAEFYKAGVTIPASNCTTVGVGGHISGGGYGLLTRMYGIAPDWITAVDIVTVDHKGKVQLRQVDKKNDPDLLRACRGSGGGSYGVVTAFYADKLPPAPKEVLTGRISFPAAGITPERLHRIAFLYSNYLETRGLDKDTWGLFTILGFSPLNGPNARIGMSVQFCNMDGTAQDTKVLDEFFSVFDECKPISEVAHTRDTPGAEHLPDPSGPGTLVCLAQHNVMLRKWIDTALPPGGLYGSAFGGRLPAPGAPAVAPSGRALRRQQYKSAYTRTAYTKEESMVFYNLATGKYGMGPSASMDSFGGAASQPHLLEETSDAHRSSIIKMQFNNGWADAADDADRTTRMNRFYTDLWSASSDGKHVGTPAFNDHTQGCYINYPDEDMLKYSYWPELYWGNGGLYPFLQRVKKKYDPNNTFHHAMSVRAT